uniref:Uncharacterized protein n=1 Tax=Arion vulgaris TaxID=1028688 RepID=A0A0B7A6G9_9EUPU
MQHVQNTALHTKLERDNLNFINPDFHLACCSDRSQNGFRTCRNIFQLKWDFSSHNGSLMNPVSTGYQRNTGKLREPVRC